MAGGCAWWEVRGRGACVAGVRAWQGGHAWRGVCMVGGGWSCVSCVAGKTAIAAGGTHSIISFQISVLSDLPVGENLQDHVFVDHPIFETKDPIGVVIDKAKSIWSVLDYYIFGQGTFLM